VGDKPDDSGTVLSESINNSFSFVLNRKGHEAEHELPGNITNDSGVLNLELSDEASFDNLQGNINILGTLLPSLIRNTIFLKNAFLFVIRCFYG